MEKNGFGSYNSAGIQIKLDKAKKIEKENLDKYWYKLDRGSPAEIFVKTNNYFYTDLKFNQTGASWNNGFDDIVRFYELEDLY